MANAREYVLVSASSGVGLSKSLEKLRIFLPSDTVIVDLEDELCGLTETIQQLRDQDITRPPGRTNWPSMYEVTWCLSDSAVVKLWQTAAEQALKKLEAADRSSLRVLSGHFIYFGGRRNQFYTPVRQSMLANERVRPSRVVHLIDDIFDMYERLNGSDQLFSSADRVADYLHQRLDDEGAGRDIGAANPDLVAYLIFERQIALMLDLLQWRGLEMETAQGVATNFDVPLLMWGVKQLSSAAAQWIKTPSPVSVYLSHPISRPRRMHRANQVWPAVVAEFNNLQPDLGKRGVVPIMPTAIDEYRLQRGVIGPLTPSPSRTPILEMRWPLPGSAEDCLYESPESGSGPEHAHVLWFSTWDLQSNALLALDEPAAGLLDQADILLRLLERRISQQVSARDHLLVSSSKAILVYRPLFTVGEYSSGVNAEIEHWKSLVARDVTRRAVLVHFLDDVVQLYEAVPESERERAVEGLLISIVSERANVGKQAAHGLVAGAETHLLDEGRVLPHVRDKVKREMPSYRIQAVADWLAGWLRGDALPGEAAPSGSVGVWLVADESELIARYDEITSFLITGQSDDAAWRRTLLDVVQHPDFGTKRPH